MTSRAKPVISIIIVHYHVKKELFACMSSIHASKSKIPYEIIVVDNDEQKHIETDLKKKFPDVIYIPNENKGFGQGNNVGAKSAKGEYLFFLNPDTELYAYAIDNLFSFLKKNKQAGIVAPLLHGKDKKPYQQGTLELNPKRGMIALSIINKFFPNNPVSNKYFLKDWDRKSTKEVDVVPGTAFMMKRRLFEQIGGFDEKFFLYFEEFDLCKRVKALGLKLYIYPEAKAFHHWGASTKTRSDINAIFLKSRFYYFKKHFGILSAFMTEAVMRIGKYTVLLAGLALLGFVLRTYKIEQTMPFIGDQGWFYLSARDMILTGNIPLVGIASSHPWLHQGALWAYLLGGWLWLFQFNPISGAYLSSIIDIIALILLYNVGSHIFSQRVGMLAAALYATSPLVILNARMPYHTSPIPLFTILFIFFLYRWIRGSTYAFPLLIMTLAVLYNFELATFVLSFIVGVVLLYGLWKRQQWARNVFQGKMLVLSFVAFILPMVPMLIYDTGHGYPQTLGFISWVGYKILVFLGLPPLNPTTPVSWATMFTFSADQYTKLIFPYSNIVALLVFVGSIGYLITQLVLQMRERKVGLNLIILSLVTMIPLAGFFAVKTPSEAYLPMLFSGIILVTAYFFDSMMQKSSLKLHAFILFSIILIANSYYLISFINKIPESYSQRVAVAKEIVTKANGEQYNIIGAGAGSQFQSFTTNYHYLTWWMGHEPSSKKQQLQFVVTEKKEEIEVKEK